MSTDHDLLESVIVNLREAGGGRQWITLADGTVVLVEVTKKGIRLTSKPKQLTI